MLTKTGIVVAFVIAGLLATSTQVQDVEKRRVNTTEFMQRKLDYTRKVVDGLATEDYGKIRTGAQELLVLSHEADWNSITSPQYVELSAEFRKSCDRLRDQGEQKNLDGATLAYFEVTLNCIRCHKQVRDGFKSALEK